MNIEQAIILLQAAQEHFDTTDMLTVKRNAHSYLVQKKIRKFSKHREGEEERVEEE